MKGIIAQHIPQCAEKQHAWLMKMISHHIVSDLLEKVAATCKYINDFADTHTVPSVSETDSKQSRNPLMEDTASEQPSMKRIFESPKAPL